MKSKYKDQLRSIIRLRKQNRIGEAVANFNDLFRFFSDGTVVLAEGVKLCLLSGEHEQAYQFYLKCRGQVNTKNFLDREILLRLKISLENIPIPELDNKEMTDGARWCTEFAATGDDPLHNLAIEDCSVVCAEGKIDYTFSSQCPSCNHNIKFVVGLTFLVYREFLCPSCFVRLSVGYEAIKSYVDANMPADFSHHLSTLDDKLINLLHNLTIDSTTTSEQFPLLCRYLNQDYLFLLNQVIFNKMNSEFCQLPTKR